MRMCLVLAGALGALATAANAQESRLTNKEALHRFVGVWTLVSWQEMPADGTKRQHP